MVYHVENPGLATLPAGIPIAVYGYTDGVAALLSVDKLPSALDSGESTAGRELWIDMANARDGVIDIVVDDDGTGMGTFDECSEANNVLHVSEGLCP